MRLIDADKMKTKIHLENMEAMEAGIKAWIDAQPTVDAVEVVRCRDCVCCDRDNGSPWCGLNGLPTDFDEYCSEGERRCQD